MAVLLDYIHPSPFLTICWPLSVSRYFCNLLPGLSWLVIAIAVTSMFRHYVFERSDVVEMLLARAKEAGLASASLFGRLFAQKVQGQEA